MKVSMKMAYVEWIASTGSSGWALLEEHRGRKPDLIRTVGFVLADTDEYLSLLQSFTSREDETTDVGDNTIVIPRVAITLERELGPW